MRRGSQIISLAKAHGLAQFLALSINVIAILDDGTIVGAARFRRGTVKSERWKLMRMLFGMILGATLTVGAAFIADSWGTDRTTTNGSSATAVEHRKMVNWDVVGDNMRVARERMRETWTKISNKIAS